MEICVTVGKLVINFEIALIKLLPINPNNHWCYFHNVYIMAVYFKKSGMRLEFTYMTTNELQTLCGKACKYKKFNKKDLEVRII